MPLTNWLNVHSDSDYIYTSKEWLQHSKESDEGYEHEYSNKYRHDRNPVVERAMQQIGVAFRCTMIQGGAPEQDAPYALMHANTIRNNSPSIANRWRTPKERDLQVKLPVNRRLLKGPLFCLIYAHLYAAQRAKHGLRGVPCVYFGYDDANDAFIVKEWVSGRISYAGDGEMHPSVFPYRANPQYGIQWVKEHDAAWPQGPVSDANPAPHAVPTGPRRSERQHDYLWSGGRRIEDIPDEDKNPDEEIVANYVHTFGPDPKNWTEAMQSPYANEWIKASLLEKNSIIEHDVFEYVRRDTVPKGHRIFNPRPVFKIKVNPPKEPGGQATLDKFKYRLTVAALKELMIEGINFTEKRASTVRWESILVLMAIACFYNMDTMLADVVTFFLNGLLKDLIFMEQPLEWATDKLPAADYVWRLKRSLYGLPQAPHCAQVRLQEVMTKGKQCLKSTADDCVYVTPDKSPSEENNGWGGSSAYVDDNLIVGHKTGMNLVLKQLKSEFNITEKINPDLIMGVQVVRCREKRWMKLHQAAYVDTILKEFKMENCTPADTPMDPGTAKHMMTLDVCEQPLTSEQSKVIKEYQTLVGMLMWLYKTRPDMMFTINLLCRFLSCATDAHLKLACGRPLRYLRGSKYWGIVFHSGTRMWKLFGQSDADLAGDLRTSRSTSGHFVRLGLFGMVSTYCKLERKISTSTGQAETYALESLSKNVVWLRHLLADLGMAQNEPTEVETDNQGVEGQSTKLVNHATAKHYRIAQAYIRYLCTEELSMKVGKVHTSKNASDIFTKALPQDSFRRHRYAIMGPQSQTWLDNYER